jgi:hypothetical protein
MTEQETERHNDKTCIFPGCDRPAIETKGRGFEEGWKANYCDLEEHNAGNLFKVLNKKEDSEAEAKA